MTLRKLAGLLAAFGLTVGLIGGGVGAAFQDQVTATENISVGTFACKIVSATPGAASDGIAADGKSLTFTSPTIMSSAAGSAPFSFTVQNTGSINQQLTIAVGGPNGSLSNKFSAVTLAPASPVALVAGASQAFNTGIQWTTLDSTDLGDSGSFTWTVNCDENAPAPIFDNTDAVLAGNYPSQPFQAQQTFEWGTQIKLAGTARDLSSAVVTMSTWALNSDWPALPAAGWTHNITLNLYNINVGNPNLPGTLIDSVTQTFTIPWRPAADPTCPDTGYGAGFAWRNPANNTCYNGFAFNITFDLSGENITAPDALVFGIAYNTQTYGAVPMGTGGPYDSLNVATFPGVPSSAGNQPSVGTFPDPTIVFWDTVTASWYTDGGAGGVGIFRRDTGWGGYEPAIKFTATN